MAFTVMADMTCKKRDHKANFTDDEVFAGRYSEENFAAHVTMSQHEVRGLLLEVIIKLHSM